VTANQQRKFYFPQWNDCCKANAWRMSKGRLVGQREERFGHGEADHLYQAVWDVAEILAQREHRSVTPTDLRHACHIVALESEKVGSVAPRGPLPSPGGEGARRADEGERALAKRDFKLISSRDLTTAQTNRVVRLFEILTDPDDLAAMLAWTDPGADKRQSLVRWINSMNVPEAYICEVAKIFSSFNYPYWADLDLAQLTSLARLLKKRIDAKQVGSVPARQGPPRGPSGNVGSSVTLAPSAQDKVEVPF
jgi:hypothetical protein